MRASPVDIPLAGGVRQDIHRQMLPNGALSQVTNCRIRKQGGLSLRKGYEAVTKTVVGPYDKDGATPTQISGTALRMVSHGNELLLLTTQGLWAYQENLDRWAFRGDIGRFAAGQKEILREDANNDVNYPGIAYANGYSLSCYKVGATGTSIIYVELRREGDGALVFAYPLFSADATRCKVCASGTTLAVFAVDTVTNQLRGSVVDTATIPTTMGTDTLISATNAGNDWFDVCPHPSGGFVTAHERAAGGFLMTHVSVALAAVNTHSRATAIAADRTAVCAVGTNLFAAWVDTATGAVNAFATNSALALLLAETAVDAAAASNQAVSLIASTAANTAMVFYTGYTGNASYVCVRTLTTAGVVGSETAFNGVELVSRPFRLTNNELYMVTCTRSEFTRSYFVVCVDDRTVASTRYTHARFALNISPKWQDIAHISDVAAVGTDSFAWAGRAISRGLVTTASPPCRADVYRFSATSSERCSVAQLGESLYISNGTLVRYDGMRIRELNFHQAPDILAAAVSNGAGALTPTGAYSYVATYERRDRNGQRHQSPPSAPFAVTMGAADDTVDLTISDYKLYSFEAQEIYIDSIVAHLWRTTNGGTIYRRVTPDTGSTASASGFFSSALITYTDTMSDADLTSQETLYTEGGILPHDTNIPCKYLAASKDRLWIAGLEDVTCAQASKIYVAGEPVQFADDEAFRVRIPEPITAIASMDGALIIFSRNGAWIVQGEGPDDKGIGSFGAPERLPVSSGCIDHRSVVVFRDGVAFRSVRGLEMIPRGFGAPVWFGRPIQSETDDYSASVSSACVFPEEGLLKFSLGLGDTTRRVVNYDYENGQWIVDSPASGGVVECMAPHNGTMYLCARTPSDANGIFREGPGYADFSAGFTATVVTGDIRVAGLTGFQRLRQVDLLGEYKDDCTLTISTVFPVIGQTDFISKAMTGTDGDPVRLSWRPSMQKCDTFRLGIIMSGASSSEALVINGLTLHVLRLPGSGRLDASRRL